MRKTLLRCGLALLASLTLAGGAHADMRQTEIERLAEARDRLIVGAESVKPNQAARMREEAGELQAMIDRARSGKALDPTKVDRAVKSSYRNY